MNSKAWNTIVRVSFENSAKYINYPHPDQCQHHPLSDGYDISVLSSVSEIENATRYCYPNGTWENANFDQCQYLGEATMIHEFTPSVDLPFYIYCIGYVLSLISLSLGLVVFLHFKQVFHSRIHTAHGRTNAEPETDKQNKLYFIGRGINLAFCLPVERANTKFEK